MWRRILELLKKTATLILIRLSFELSLNYFEEAVLLVFKLAVDLVPVVLGYCLQCFTALHVIYRFTTSTVFH